MSENIVNAMLRDKRLDERRRDIIERALKLARRETYLASRETGDRYARVVFDCERGEIRVIIDMSRHDDGQTAESLDLKIIELGSLVFHATAGRLRDGNGNFRTATGVHRDVRSYWEAILLYIS